MRFSSRTLVVVGFFSLGVGLLLPSIGRSQEPRRIPGLRLPSKPSDAGKLPTVVGQPPAVQPPKLPLPSSIPNVTVTTDMERLNRRIADLEAKVVAQQKMLDNVNKIATSAPKGYSKAFITMGNVNRLSPNDGLSYWARIDNK